ncbi:hypothetical protein COX97_02730 [Candidatus Pacearchaeota archaeon CG_4_10_14_0_2_um_filter_05_32_18]|nr:MAG: hypothetical protein COX97_02730 [Candidatus Pacearchaeota archaeon CG_4_10_14_0_2_um_filter_05_32_18]
MAKITAWVVTILGVLLLLPLLGVDQLGTATDGYLGWIIAIGVLAIGLTKLARNYNLMKKR